MTQETMKEKPEHGPQDIPGVTFPDERSSHTSKADDVCQQNIEQHGSRWQQGSRADVSTCEAKEENAQEIIIIIIMML